MTLIHQLRPGRSLFLSLIAPVLIACSGSTGPDDDGCDDCGSGEVQFARVVVTPSSGTVARGGGSVPFTVNLSVSPNMTMRSVTINKQYSGLVLTQTGTQGTGANITRSYTISADNTVPVGNHIINYVLSFDGATGTVQEQNPGRFTLTVTD